MQEHNIDVFLILPQILIFCFLRTAAFIKTPFCSPTLNQWFQTIKSNLMNVIDSGAPAFTNYSLPFMALIPNGPLFTFLHSPYQGFSLSFSTVPGPYESHIYLLGSKIKTFLPIYGLQWRHAGKSVHKLERKIFMDRKFS